MLLMSRAKCCQEARLGHRLEENIGRTFTTRKTAVYLCRNVQTSPYEKVLQLLANKIMSNEQTNAYEELLQLLAK